MFHFLGGGNCVRFLQKQFHPWDSIFCREMSLNWTVITVIYQKHFTIVIFCWMFFSQYLFCSIWWIIAFAVSVYLCGGSIYNLLLKWKENPVIVSFDNKLLSIGEIPFPAMTICPLTKSNTDKFNYTKVYRSLFKLDGENSQTTTEEEYVNRLLSLINTGIRIGQNMFKIF